MKILIADKVELNDLTDCEITSVGLTQSELPNYISDFDILVVRSTKVDKATILAGDKLKLIVRAGSGCDTIDIEEATRRDVRVCNCPGANSVAVAELTFGLMIAADRRIPECTRDLKAGIWNKPKYSRGLGLKGRTLGIIGMGHVGREVLRLAHAFGMDVVYYDVERDHFEEAHGLKYLPFYEVLKAADFLTIHVSDNPQTQGMIGKEELALMKSTACLINCSRGGIVDETALARALYTDKLKGVALDVFENEPAAGDREFKDSIVKFSSVCGTHHIGASTKQAQEAVAKEASRVIRHFIDGNIVNCMNLRGWG